SNLAHFTGTVTVVQSGSTYTVTFSNPLFATLSGTLVLTGSIPHTQEGTASAFAAALQSQIQSLFQQAGVTGGAGVAVGTSSGALTVASSSQNFTLSFPEPIVASAGGGR